MERDSPEAKKSGSRSHRKIMYIAVSVAGMAIILGVSVKHELWDMAFIVAGLVLIEVGIWRLAHKLLPEPRKYNALRSEANRFLRLTRQLNTAALKVKERATAENLQAVEEIRKRMVQQVDRMVAVAGKTDVELAPDAVLNGSSGLGEARVGRNPR